MPRWTLSLLPEEFAICRLPGTASLPSWALGHDFFAIVRTPEELSLVCPAWAVPANTRAVRGWRGLKVHGPLDFDQIGVLAALSGILAQARVSVFALSTYDTDYLFLRQRDVARAIAALRAAGHRVHEAAGGPVHQK